MLVGLIARLRMEKKSIREERNKNGEAIKLQHRTEHKSYSISAFSPLLAHRLVLIGYLRDLTVKRLAVRREKRRDEEEQFVVE